MLPVMVGNPGAPPCGLETQPSTRAAIGAGRNFCSIMESASLMSNARNGSESALALRKSLPAVCCCRAPLSQMGHAFALPGACSLIFAAGLKVRSSLGAAEFPFLSLQIPWRQTLTGCLCRIGASEASRQPFVLVGNPRLLVDGLHDTLVKFLDFALDLLKYQSWAAGVVIFHNYSS